MMELLPRGRSDGGWHGIRITAPPALRRFFHTRFSQQWDGREGEFEETGLV